MWTSRRVVVVVVVVVVNWMTVLNENRCEKENIVWEKRTKKKKKILHASCSVAVQLSSTGYTWTFIYYKNIYFLNLSDNSTRYLVMVGVHFDPFWAHLSTIFKFWIRELVVLIRRSACSDFHAIFTRIFSMVPSTYILDSSDL